MSLKDLDHWMGGDLAVTVGGDLQPCSLTLRGQQRVLRRLLTNPGEYIFHPEYGAGLPQHIGRTTEMAKLRALILSQMALEDCVARMPSPEVNLRLLEQAPLGAVSVSIRYIDAPTQEPVTLRFNLSK